MSGVDLAAIRDWTAANKRARDEYRNHPLADDLAVVCLKCDNDRIPARAYCSFHWADKLRGKRV